MSLSTFDIFKIGIGPSSSHTMGAMVAAGRFLQALRHEPRALWKEPLRIQIPLHGSLAFTGKGHATDRAVILSFLGFLLDSIDPDRAERDEAVLRERKVVVPAGLPEIAFDPDTDLLFHRGVPLPGHANGLVFEVVDDGGAVLFDRIYYSVGGGFVQSAEQLEDGRAARAVNKRQRSPPSR